MATNEGEEVSPSDSASLIGSQLSKLDPPTGEIPTEEQTGSLPNPTSQSVPEDPLANIMRIFALDAERREV